MPAADTAPLATLKARFEAHMARHAGIAWNEVEARLRKAPAKRKIIAAMEESGGEPDVVGREDAAFVFVDCAPESPTGRRSLCFDKAARDTRKENKPKSSVTEMAAAIGVTLLDEAQYRALQELFPFDLKTSSWIATPANIRKRGGALFCDRRYDAVFTYHNSAESYYASRGFRGRVLI